MVAAGAWLLPCYSISCKCVNICKRLTIWAHVALFWGPFVTSNIFSPILYSWKVEMDITDITYRYRCDADLNYWIGYWREIKNVIRSEVSQNHLKKRATWPNPAQRIRAVCDRAAVVCKKCQWSGGAFGALLPASKPQHFISDKTIPEK